MCVCVGGGGVSVCMHVYIIDALHVLIFIWLISPVTIPTDTIQDLHLGPTLLSNSALHQK